MSEKQPCKDPLLPSPEIAPTLRPEVTPAPSPGPIGPDESLPPAEPNPRS